MSDTTGPIDHDFAEAVALARDLVARLASDLEFRGQDGGQAATTLRNAGDALTRLSVTTAARAPVSDNDMASTSAIVLDVSDLLGYFEKGNRLPTGIQRVQAELIAAILQADDGHTAQLCCFVRPAGQDRFERALCPAYLRSDTCTDA